MRSVSEILDELKEWLLADVSDKADLAAHELLETLRMNQEDGDNDDQLEFHLPPA